MGGGEGSGTADGSGSSGSGDPMLADNASFEFSNPNWAENNYLSTPLIEAGYERGSEADLERMGDREVEEVPHGNPVQEPPSSENEYLDPDTLVLTESPSEDVEGRYEEDFAAVFERV